MTFKRVELLSGHALFATIVSKHPDLDMPFEALNEREIEHRHYIGKALG